MVLVSVESSEPEGLARISDRLELRVVDDDGLAAALPGAGALLMWESFSPALAEAWPAADALEWIHVAAAGVDKMMFEELRGSDVVLTNARGAFDRPIAEFVLAGVLAQVKRLYASHDLQRERTWRHLPLTSVEGQRALVIGTGAIGREIARLLRAVGMEVRGAGRRPGVGDADFGLIEPSDDLAAHVGWADHVINATPLTAATTGLLDAEVFSAMRPGAHVVNIGRGESLVEDDLEAALRSGHLGGATLDVFATEPLPAESTLWDAPGLVVSAHMSGEVAGWEDRLVEQFVDNAERWLAGEELTNVVDKRLGYVPSG